MGSNSSTSYSTGSIVLQVPEHNFTMLVDQVRHAGMATSVVTSANDVTGQYVDLQARISALQVEFGGVRFFAWRQFDPKRVRDFLER